MADGPGQSQTYGNGVVNNLEAQRMAVMQAGGYYGQISPVPTGKVGTVSLGRGRRVPIDPSDRKFYNRPGVMQQYIQSNVLPLDKAISEFNYLTTEELQEWATEVTRRLQYDVRKDPRQLAYVWESNMQELANYQAQTGNMDIGPVDFLRQYNDRLEKAGLAKPIGMIGSGAGGGYRGPVTTYDTDTVIDITNPSQVKLLLDNTLQNYLGRDATAEERSTFMDTLNKLQREQPQVVESVTKMGPSGRPTQTRKSRTERVAGIEPQAVAQEFARSREEAAERRMGGQYMDWFMQKLMQAPQTEMVSSGL